MRRSMLVATGVALWVLGTAAGAQAATVSVTDGTLRFTAAGGERNTVTIDSAFAAPTTVTDTTAALVAGPGCATTGAHTATCAAAQAAVVDLGAGDDSITRFTAAFPVTIRAGSGDDAITGLSAYQGFIQDATIDGGSGDDRIDGGAFMENAVDGGPGDDQLAHRARSGGTLDGGPGRDHLIHNSLFGGTLLGGPGEDLLEREDAVANFPAMDGGPGNDELRVAALGFFGATPPRGGPGHDLVQLVGLAASVALSDHVEPGFTLTVYEDVEELRGTPGGDTLVSNDAAHALFGEAGDDTLRGRGGRDELDGGDGSDTVDAVDGERDARIACGGGLDSVALDPVDRLARGSDCETVAGSTGV